VHVGITIPHPAKWGSRGCCLLRVLTQHPHSRCLAPAQGRAVCSAPAAALAPVPSTAFGCLTLHHLLLAKRRAAPALLCFPLAPRVQLPGGGCEPQGCGKRWATTRGTGPSPPVPVPREERRARPRQRPEPSRSKGKCFGRRRGRGGTALLAPC